MKTFNTEPNFSIVLPGGCNAHCSFCFWKEEKASEDYLEKLKSTLLSIPSHFKQCSLTGGEPTLSVHFIDVLKIAFAKFSKVVLTTNGCNLETYIPEIEKLLKKTKTKFHVNISRHHHDNDKNMEMFGTDTIPSNDSLVQLINKLNKIGIDVNANCVLTEEYDSRESIEEFIQFAKQSNFSSIAFRKQHGNLEPSNQELFFNDYKPLYVGKCPVCYTKEQLVLGMKVQWKSSMAEPKETITDSVYELIYQQNGKLTMDWEGKEEIITLEDELYTPNQIVKMAKEGLIHLGEESRKKKSTSIRGGGCCGSGRGC